MSVFFGGEGTLVFRGIAAQGKDIVDAQVMEVDEGIFGLLLGEPAANDMGDHLDRRIFVFDGGGDGHGSGAFPDGFFLQQPVFTFFVNDLLLVIGYIDKRGVEFHQRVDGPVDAVDIVSP